MLSIRNLLSYIIIFSFTSMILGGVSSNACIGGPLDSVAVEVVLNKPGILYDLGVLENVRNVVKVDEHTFVYRSHIDGNITVIVTLESTLAPGADPKYLAIRIQPKASYIEIPRTMYSAHLELRNISIDPSTIPTVAEARGWSIKDVDRYAWLAGILEKKISNTTVTVSYKFAPISSDEKILFIIVEVDGNLTDQVYNDTKSLIDGIAGREIELNLTKTRIVDKRIIPLCGEDKVVEALVYELEWLSSIGVVDGLEWRDIVELRNLAKPGMAGWNNRIVYANGRWMKYSDAIEYIGGAVFSGRCSDIDTLLENVELPQAPPNYTLAARPLHDNGLALMISVLIGLSASLASLIIIARRL